MVETDDGVARCGAATKSGGPCRNRVAHPGERCRLHQGAPAVAEASEPPPVASEADAPAAAPAPAPASSTPGEGTGGPAAEESVAAPPEPPDPRLVRAAQRCAPALAAGALEAVDALATPYLGDAGWGQLRDSWRWENCTLVATVARQALESPARLHDAAGKLAAQIWIWLGRPWLEQMMVREVVKRLPVLGEAQVRPVARAVQLAGIRLCYDQHDDLTQCPCFVDLVEKEGERRPRQLLDAGVKGWDGLARLR